MIAGESEWKNFADIRSVFPSADYVGNQHYVFNISGNKFRLVVVVKFVMGYVFVRWVGRHKDYEKEFFPIEKPTVAELIADGLIEKSMTQKELASILGVSPSRISELVSGKSEPSLRQASQLCQTLGITPALMLGL